MFNLEKAKNWTKSSVADNKNEQIIYQKFQDQITSIENKIKEYIKDQGYQDVRLYIKFKDRLLSIPYLEAIIQSVKDDNNLSPQNRAFKVATITNFYNQQLQELSKKIISISLTERDNVYLAYIHESLMIINSLLKEYAYLPAIQRSKVYQINNQESNAGDKIKKLKDAIELRLVEIEHRLTVEETKRFKRLT